MVPSILVNAAQGSKLVIGGAGGDLIISAVAHVSLGTPGWKGPSLSSPVVRPALLGPGRGWCGVAGTPALRPFFHPISLPQAIMNTLWLGFDLQAAIAAPILHVNDQGQVEYESNFSQVRQRSGPPLGQTPQSMHAAPRPRGGSQRLSVLSPAHFSVRGHRELSSVASKAENRLLSIVLPGRAPHPHDPCCLCSFLQKLVVLGVASQALPQGDLFPHVICSFYLQVYL